LVNPPFYRIMGSHYNGMSLGISYVAAVLNRAGHDAWLYNADFLDIDQYRTLYNCFKEFSNYIEIFRDDRHEIWEEVTSAILNFAPDWVGYTCYTANVSAVNIISQKVKSQWPRIKQVVGGVQSTLDPELLHKVPAIDFSIGREGEYAMLDLVNCVDPSKIQGVSCRNSSSCGVGTNHKDPIKISHNGKAEVIRDLDQLPYPERDKFWGRDGIMTEAKRHMDVSYVISIRGCPYRCAFCASPNVWGRANTVFRSPEKIIEEMQFVRQHYWCGEHVDFGMLSANSSTKDEMLKESLVIRDNTIVYFVDDIFTLNKDRVKTLMRKMVDTGLNMPWKCESRADRIDQEMADLMAASLCKRVKIGFESGSNRILKQIKKDETKEDMIRGVQHLKKAGVPITGYFMAGFPGETDQDLMETVEFAKSLELDYYSLSILAPYYGTDIHLEAVNSGEYELDKQPWEYFFHYTRELIVNKSLSQSALEVYWKLCDVRKYV
jgi:anaerobic magnesium-protoporphyrin IX monomethyl ester cyclase